ncbi:MAG: TIGR04002 family protein [Acutalibacteraceae bacterium]|nr:TIGR04002 family protein [Acutalibacteraceae bacterium]
MARKGKYQVNPTTVKIVQAALFTAIIFVFTMFVKVPVGIGYIHLGDAFLYLYACMGGGWYALLAGALGEGLADLAGGFAIYAPATIIIKPLVALPFVLLSRREPKILNLKTGLTNILAAVISTVGYFFANWVIFAQSDAATSFKSALVAAPGTLIQAAGSTVVFFVAAFALDKVHMKDRMLSYTGRPAPKKAN